eukprot:scaffold82897_cov68-Phaeocystis_antarctica.AAC.3
MPCAVVGPEEPISRRAGEVRGAGKARKELTYKVRPHSNLRRVRCSYGGVGNAVVIDAARGAWARHGHTYLAA